MFIKNENASNDWKQREMVQQKCRYLFMHVCVCMCVCLCVCVFVCVCVCLCVCVSQNLLAEGMKNMIVNSTIRLLLGVF